MQKYVDIDGLRAFKNELEENLSLVVVNSDTYATKAELNSRASTDTATTSTAGLMSAADKAKLISIEDSAQVNVIESVKVNNSELTPSSKAVNIDLSNYVAKDGDKVLSTNDYTTAEKNKLANIPSDAESNVIETVKVNGTALTPANKAVNIDLSNYVVKDGSKVLSSNDYTTTEKNKLSGIAEGANNYVLPTASNSTLGGVKIGSNISISGGAISITKDNVTNALGYTPPTTNTTYSIGNTSTAGLTKLYTSTGTATDGTMTQNAIKSALDGKLGSTATATSADKLSTARSLKVSLASTSAPTFDGSANVTTIGVGGILPTAYGGTGNANGTVSGAAQLNTARNIVTNLASTVPASFNGTASVSAGVTGTLPVVNGGTGQTSLDNVTVGGAIRDGAGNVISDTYVTKSEFQRKVNAVRLGYRIKKTEADPYARVEYLYDAVGMIPAHMDFTNGVFDYGSWADVWFVADNKPLMLKSDGTVGYYLNPNDYSKKKDGTASDVANIDYDGNAMAQFPLCWICRYEDNDYQYEIVSNVQYDENYKAYAHTRADGSIADYIYASCFEASGDTSRLRSLSEQTIACYMTIQNQINGAIANGNGWYINSWSRRELIRTLIVLLGKSTNSQAVFGNGSSQGNSVMLKTGTLIDKGQFFGYTTTNQQVKCFHVEGLWGNMYDHLVGCIAYNYRWYVKMTPEGTGYSVNVSNRTGYTNVCGYPSTTGSYIKSCFCSEYGMLPNGINGSSATYYCDQFVSSGTGMPIVGGGTNTGSPNIGIFQNNSWNDQQVSNNVIGCTLSYA